MIPFGEWLPDLPAFQNPGATVAKNVIPLANSYGPLPGFSVFSDALTAYCRGAIAVKDKDGTVYNYAGDATKLYSISDGAWSDISIGGGYATGSNEFWEFTKWGEKVLATNFSNNPQSITMGGANFGNLTTALKFRHIAVVRNFVVAGNTTDVTDGNVPNRVRWSAINDETDWTVSATTQADFQDLHGPQGWVQAIRGGEYGVVFQEFSIWRMTYVGSPTVFQFDETLPGYGTPAPNSVVRWGDTCYFLGHDGFYAVVDGTQIVPIGANKIDRTFYEDLDEAEASRVVGAIDPINKIVFWAYPGRGNTVGCPNKLLMYNWTTNRWSEAEAEQEWIFNSFGTGYTLEGLDAVSASIDALPESLDSRSWVGGAVQLGVFNKDHKLGYFSGTPLAGTMETAETQLFPGRRAFIRSVRPMVDGDNPIIQVGSRNRQEDDFVWSAVVGTNSSGDCPVRNNARYHRIRVLTSGDFNHAMGVQAKATPIGMR